MSGCKHVQRARLLHPSFKMFVGLLASLVSLYVSLSLLSGGVCQDDSNATYTNPILTETGADPWVIRHDGYYYMTFTTNVDITLLRSKVLTNWNNADRRTLFRPPPGRNYSTSLWAPELHHLTVDTEFGPEKKWYIIFTADPRNDNPVPEIDMLCEYSCPAVHHRMYVLEGSSSSSTNSSSPWDQTFTYKSQLDTYDQFAIDGTYFQHNNSLYHIYSCWRTQYDGWPANLCITRMSNPWTVSSPLSDRQILSSPTNAWEKTPHGRTINDRLSTNEGPQQLTNPATNATFVIYSAGRSDNRNYCLGLLAFTGTDPMNPEDWEKDESGCVFYQNAEEDVYGVGHASFVESPDGEESWIVYHGMREPGLGWAARTIRAQRFEWGSAEEGGRPLFPRPGMGPYEVPSGQSGSGK